MSIYNPHTLCYYVFGEDWAFRQKYPQIPLYGVSKPGLSIFCPMWFLTNRLRCAERSVKKYTRRNACSRPELPKTAVKIR